jgi:hypothetical protein
MSFTQPEAATSLQRGEREHSSSVILPLKKSSSRVFVPFSHPLHRFLPGNRPEVTLSSCGKWMWRGCLETEKHGFNIAPGQRKLNGEAAKGWDVVEAYKMSCQNLSCPVCYEKACGKEAARIENRILQYRRKWGRTRYYHWTVSPPEKRPIDVGQLRKEAYRIAKMAGIQGGCCIFHHLRSYNEDDLAEDVAAGSTWKTAPASWYWSPHFHIMGVGFTSPQRVVHTFEKSGWVVKNLGERQNVRSTAMYQLSHAFIPEKGHSVTWFGCMAYNKLKVRPLPPQDHSCPVCGSEFRKLKFVSSEAEAIVKSMFQEEGVQCLEHGYFVYKNEVSPPWRGYG